MKVRDYERRHVVMQAARAKWEDKRIAFVENPPGHFALKALTGIVASETIVNGVIVVREKSVIYWTGSSVEEAERVVGLR